MNTRPQEVLPYRDLARQQARISRQIGLAELPRVRSLAAAESAAPLEVTLTFAQDHNGLVRVSGDVAGSLPLNCNRCAETMDRAIELDFMCTIVATEEQAVELAGREPGSELDIMVADGLEVSLADLVEDEILLGLPERLCLTEPCDRAPMMHYPAAGAGVEQVGDGDDPAPRDNPFSVLAGLNVGEKDSNDLLD